MPGGCRLWAVPSYLCPSPSLPHPSPHPQPLFVHIWWQKLCRPAALAFCHSGMLRWPTAQKVPHCECSFWKWVFVCVLFKVDLRKDKYRMWLLLYPLLNLSISNLIVTLNKLTHQEALAASSFLAAKYSTNTAVSVQLVTDENADRPV